MESYDVTCRSWIPIITYRTLNWSHTQRRAKIVSVVDECFLAGATTTLGAQQVYLALDMSRLPFLKKGQPFYPFTFNIILVVLEDWRF